MSRRQFIPKRAQALLQDKRRARHVVWEQAFYLSRSVADEDRCFTTDEQILWERLNLLLDRFDLEIEILLGLGHRALKTEAVSVP